MPTDFSHLDALRFRLHNEQQRNAHPVTIAGIEKEIASELKFLGITSTDNNYVDDDELLADLFK